jgi:hypothetical protein
MTAAPEKYNRARYAAISDTAATDATAKNKRPLGKLVA